MLGYSQHAKKHTPYVTKPKSPAVQPNERLMGWTALRPSSVFADTLAVPGSPIFCMEATPRPTGTPSTVMKACGSLAMIWVVPHPAESVAKAPNSSAVLENPSILEPNSNRHHRTVGEVLGVALSRRQVIGRVGGFLIGVHEIAELAA